MVSRECDGAVATRSAWLYIIGFVSFIPGFVGACKLEQCVNEYSSALEEGGLKGPESTAAYCQQLRAYGACVKAASRSCRGDLQYHSTGSIISTLTKRFNCSRFRPKPQRQECSYYGRQHYSYCTLYGQPHLLTFSSLYCNCKFQATTALIDNQFFSVVVTRGQLDYDDALLSQINITIKSGGTPCASEKQYVAYADQQLPPFFTDETQTGDLRNSILINSSWEGVTETVQIYMRYIDTTIVIKKSGSYFGFSCRMPSDILNFDPGGLEVCRNGCLDSDVIDTASARAEQLIWRRAMEKCSDYTKFSSSSSNRTAWRLRDWCLFDVISSSQKERTSFTSPTLGQEASGKLPATVPPSNNNEDNEISPMSKGYSPRLSILTSILCLIFVILFSI